jgi:hypothetical protein
MYVDKQETGKVYHYVNEYNLYIDNNHTFVKVVLCESFYSYSMLPLDHHTIRGTSFITIKYEIDEYLINDNCKNVLTTFCNMFDERMKSGVESFQRDYAAEYYWENPSYYESDGTVTLSDTVANRHLCAIEHYTQFP